MPAILPYAKGNLVVEARNGISYLQPQYVRPKLDLIADMEFGS